MTSMHATIYKILPSVARAAAARHFAGVPDLVLVAVPVAPLGPDGAHVFPEL